MKLRLRETTVARPRDQLKRSGRMRVYGCVLSVLARRERGGVVVG
jgi:hypothetical protein